MLRPVEPPPSALNLRRRGRMPAWLSLLLRVGLALSLLAVTLLGHWIGRDGLKDNIDGAISFVDVVYFTMITVTTVGYGDIVPVTDEARLFDTFVVTPIRLFVWLIFLGTAYDFLLRRVWERWRMGMIQRGLKDHVVVAGFGMSGSEAARELVRRGAPATCLVAIDLETTPLAAAEEMGAAVLQGDATRDATLEAAHVGRARAVVVTAGRDDTSILIVLTARRLAPEAPISVVIREKDNVGLARQAGADTVINPTSLTGLLLAGSTHGQHLADYVSDLASCEGEVALNERPAAPEEVGRPLSTITTGLGLRILRGGRAIGFSDPGAQRIEDGDLIIEAIARRPTVRSDA